MGNMHCCQQQPQFEYFHTITIIQKQEVKIPLLNPIIVDHLQKYKPFQNQIPPNPVLKKFGADIFQGELDEDGRPTGYGRMYHKGGSVYIGQFSHGIANGIGHYVMTDGSFYQGKMKDNSANDEENGFFHSPHIDYTGCILNNEIHGFGRQKGLDAFHQFEGDYKHGKKVKGTLRWLQNGRLNQYNGSFNQQENFEGSGILIMKGIGKYTGQFINGEKHGKGQFNFDNGWSYKGDYSHNVKEGYGRLTNKGTIIFEGEFKKGLPDGKGKSSNNNGVMNQGFWVQGIDKILLSQ